MINQQDIDNIPQELRNYSHWVCYRLVDNGKLNPDGTPKLDKVPHDPHRPGKPGAKAKPNDPKTWGPFDLVLKIAQNQKYEYDGIGYVFFGDDPFTGIDLDHCVQDGVIQPWAQEIIKKMGSYSEFSPSGTGVHIYVEAIKPNGGCKKGDVEIYVTGRFLTITGNRLDDTPLVIEKRQEELNGFHADVFGNHNNLASKPDYKPTTILTLSDTEIINTLDRASNSYKFKALFHNGDISAYGNDDSTADLALCGLIVFYTKDHEQIDRIFRQSALLQNDDRKKKWDGRHGPQTYGDMTISKAINGAIGEYKGKRSGNVFPGPGASKQTSSAEALPETESDEWRNEIEQIIVNPDPVEAEQQVRYFVLTKLLHYDEMIVKKILKNHLKFKFHLDSDDIKGHLKAWKEEKKQKQAESKAMEEKQQEESSIILNPIFEKDGRIYKKKVKMQWGEKVYEDVPLATFTIEPLESITIEGKETLRVNLKAGDKVFKNIILPSECWESAKTFTRILPGKETTYTGGNIDTQQLRYSMTSFSMPHKLGVKTSGFHDGRFVTEEGALSPQGVSEDVIYFNEMPSRCKLLSVEPATKKDLLEIGKYIAGFNTPTVTLPVIGWIASCFLKNIIHETVDKFGLGNGFPLLNIQGEAGAGKTGTSNSVIMRTWAIDGEAKSIGELTKFTMMKLVDGSNTIPVILEENKSCMQTDYHKNIISNLIRSTYNRLEGGRGKADLSTQEFCYQAPVVIIGESGFVESALLDRNVTIFLSKKDSAPYLQNFQELRKLPLEKLGRSILEKALRMDREEIESILVEELGAVGSVLADRPRTNAAVVRFGLRLLSDILEIQFDLSRVDEAVKEGMGEGDSSNRKSAVDKILEAMCLMSSFKEEFILFKDTGREEKRYKYQDHLEEGIDFEVIRDPGVPILKLHISNAYSVFKKWAKAYSFEGDLLPQMNFSKQLKKEVYCTSIGTARIGGKEIWGATIDINKMRNKGLELSEFWGVNPDDAPF
ncbi:MAG: hypothetical protein QG610_638 [Euryarchaeota archaeon]|nr:hypothetical protein [Euryarchaeota archaeon]